MSTSGCLFSSYVFEQDVTYLLVNRQWQQSRNFHRRKLGKKGYYRGNTGEEIEGRLSKYSKEKIKDLFYEHSFIRNEKEM